MALPVTARPHRVSELMRRLLDTAMDGETVSVAHILQVFGVRGFAFLLLILSLLNIVIFMVPMISVIFGLPMVILAAQMALGLKTPIFPAWIRDRTLPRAALVKGLETAIAGVRKAENFIKPRLLPLSDPRLARIHGIAALMLAIMVTLPIPVFNVPPSAALAVLALGMMQRDGLLILMAYGLGFWCLVLFKSIGHLAHSLAG